MGKGADRNKLCRCGSGKKIKNCGCKLAVLDSVFPEGVVDLGNGAKWYPLVMYDASKYEKFGNTEGSKYAPFYSPDQISRLISPSSAKDILMKKQGDSIVDNMRVLRVFYKRYNHVQEWDYEKIIDSSIFDDFNELINDESVLEEVKNIPCGLTYDSDPNGQCIKTEYGNIITISAVLQKFLYYMNLFYLGMDDPRIPMNVAKHALVLAIRIMLQKEALDFELDSRGDVPEDVNVQLETYTLFEMFFVIAHEYSHSILKHLDSRNIVESTDHYVYYNQSQLQEFEADENAIDILSEMTTEEIALDSAVNFFMAMDVFEQAKEQIYPSMSFVKTHPKASERIRKLMSKHPKIDIDVENLIGFNRKIKDELMDMISLNFELFDIYGSVYLGEWHKKQKIDRVDY